VSASTAAVAVRRLGRRLHNLRQLVAGTILRRPRKTSSGTQRAPIARSWRRVHVPAARMPPRLPVTMSLLLTIGFRRNTRWRHTGVRRYVALLQLRPATPRVAARRRIPLPLVTGLPCSMLRRAVNTRCNRMRARLDLRALRVLPVVKIRPGARVATGKFRLLDRIHSRHSKFFASSGSPCPL
jgi:hypothetical protein